MKRAVLILFLLTMAVPAAFSQKGMAIGELFSSGLEKQPNVVEVIVKGKKLEPYHLTVFRSLTVKSDAAMAERMDKLVLSDAKAATDREQGMTGGRLYYGFFTFANGDGTFRYVFYRNNLLRKGAKPETTVVYMEGKATLAQLKSMFK